MLNNYLYTKGNKVIGIAYSPFLSPIKNAIFKLKPLVSTKNCRNDANLYHVIHSMPNQININDAKDYISHKKTYITYIINFGQMFDTKNKTVIIKSFISIHLP